MDKRVINRTSKKIFAFSKNNDLILVFSLQVFFILTRFINYKNPLISSDYGNHLLISKYLAQGKIPYKEFSLTHMPGLYIPMTLGFLISDSIFFPFLFYVLITSLTIPVFYKLLKQIVKNKLLVFGGLFLLLTDPLLTLYSKVATFDCLALPFVLVAIILVQKKKLEFRDHLSLTGVFFISFFIKISTVYFFAFFLIVYLLIFCSDRLKVKNSIRWLTTLLLTVAVVFLALNWLRTEMFQDILVSHFLRSPLLIGERILNLFGALYLSPIGLLSALVLSFFFFFFPKNKQAKHFSLFFLLFFFFSVFFPRHFYRHHLIMLIPLGVILVLLAIEKLLLFLKSRPGNWIKFLSVFGSIILSLNFFLWLVSLTYFNSEVRKICEKATALKGRLYANNNYYYIATGKEPYFWYFTTIPDGPCRWGNCCYMHKEILTKSDYALLDRGTWRHVVDRNFYTYLYENFYLDTYDSGGGLMLYIRR